VEGARDLAAKGELCFGTIDSWLVWKLTNGKVHVTDATNASRTMLFNIHSLEWDKELLALLDIPASILPTVKSSSEVYGYTNQLFTNHEIPIAGIAGDQQSALFGQMCTAPGMVKNTYGTGCFMLMHTGEKAVSSKNNLLTTIALQMNGRTFYALEGSVFIGGAVVQWLRDGLHLIRKSSEVEDLAKQVENTDGVYLVPAFAGLGAPYWNQHARGTIVGITRGTSSAHIARAALESIAFQSYDLLKAMEADAGIPIAELRVDGGATHNNLLMQFQSDIVNTKVVRPTIVETTALGAAYLAGLAVGFWKDIEELRIKWNVDKVFSPNITEASREQQISGWQRAIKTTNNW
jgi:glycerol kinase